MGDIKNKLEASVLDLFKPYAVKLFKLVDTLTETDVLDIASELGQKFLLVCKQIADDPRFSYFDAFKSEVEARRKEMEGKLANLEPKLDQSFKHNIGENTLENYKAIYTSFYDEIDKLSFEVVEKTLEKPEDPFVYFFNKSRLLIKSDFKRDFTPEQELRIAEFRKDLTQQKKELIERPLTLRQELKLFDDYRLAIEYQLVYFEQHRWYNTIRQYTTAWISYLEKIKKFHEEVNNRQVAKKVEDEIHKIQEWVKRLDQKYDKTPQLDTNQVQLLNENQKIMILRYKTDRKELRRYEEDKRIIKFLQSI